MRLVPLFLAACHIGNADLEKRVAALEAENIRLRAELEAPRHLPVDQAAMGISRAQAETFIDARIQLAVGDQLQQLTSDVANHVAATADLRELVVADAGARTVTIQEANLHIVNGEGVTDDTTNGLGNLVLGYGEGNTLTGSHNLVVGTNHDVVGYAGAAFGEGASVGDFGLTVQSPTVELSAEALAVNGDTVSVSGPVVTVDASSELYLLGTDVLLDGADVVVSGGTARMDASTLLFDATAGIDIESAATLSLQGSLITLN